MKVTIRRVEITAWSNFEFFFDRGCLIDYSDCLSLKTFISVATCALKRCGVGALMATGLPVAAQQSIQFTKPANQDPAVTLNEFLSASHKSPSPVNAPKSLFGDGPTASFDVLPGSPQMMLNPNAAQWQKFLQERKNGNWGLMTPAQILGVPTPESILNIVDPQEDPKLSPEERYLKRQERQSQMAITNALLLRANHSLWGNDDKASGVFGGNASGGLMAEPGGDRSQGIPGLTANPNPFFNQNPRSSGDVNQKIDTTWTSAFESPEPLVKATPEQLAGMEHFRALLEGTPPPATPASGTFSTQPAPSPDPYMQRLPASFNPIGRSVAPLGSDFGRPTGLSPLSGVTGPQPVPIKPPPLVQAPPWMTQTPQIGTLQQRKF